jgi:hypothetical protein
MVTGDGAGHDGVAERGVCIDWIVDGVASLTVVLVTTLIIKSLQRKKEEEERVEAVSWCCSVPEA